MGCACNHQDIKSEKINEMQDNSNNNPINESKTNAIQNNIYIIQDSTKKNIGFDDNNLKASTIIPNQIEFNENKTNEYVLKKEEKMKKEEPSSSSDSDEKPKKKEKEKEKEKDIKLLGQKKKKEKSDSDSDSDSDESSEKKEIKKIKTKPKDLLKKLLNEDRDERIDWDGYFKHRFFAEEKWKNK